jgi:O-succinylbenzoic acid--CoA ligase
MINEILSGRDMQDAYAAIENEWNNSEVISFQTSGSTGVPKVITFTKEQIIRSAERTAEFFNLKENAEVFCALPPIYVAGKMMALRAIILQWNLTWQSPSSSPTIESTYDFAAFTSQQVSQMLAFSPTALNTIQKVLLGGGPLSERSNSLLANVSTNIFEGYGMTETLTHVAMRNVKEDSFFRALKGVHFTQGEKENLAIEDSWLNLPVFETNDTVEFVEDGFIVKGRLDNVIISGGVKFFPEELEHTLSQVILQPFYITSLADEVLGQKIVLVVEGNPRDFQLEKLDVLNMGIGKPKEVIFKPKFNRTASGKIIRES